MPLRIHEHMFVCMHTHPSLQDPNHPAMHVPYAYQKRCGSDAEPLSGGAGALEGKKDLSCCHSAEPLVVQSLSHTASNRASRLENSLNRSILIPSAPAIPGRHARLSAVLEDMGRLQLPASCRPHAPPNPDPKFRLLSPELG